ncbi:hypothetical protein ARALYDRAFT_316679 [Arabidopsis lyrata subsp. lyrata]|uniref:Plant thionin family protein n=1 Tax=Arabidopsis lyrata subsp. lyrata TaxID=81972 RepID=D7KUL6_ARALL|nr:uncharacterized protein LOC9325218 [Arabidopsis lyrata subsp. lyrata]EFH65414.1 hypothetical protein ARALYDRAFT_316679 [Arabidopsis lyrata subsp. lyrata]|eukprot:XP_002889155.1 uncharacterized protein LOC9325218 [Arabidopsis lyrata subsp. lyrata]
MAANGRVIIIALLMVAMVMNMTWCVNSKGFVNLGISPEELQSCIKACIPEQCMPEANNLTVCEKACHKYCNRPAFKSYYVVPRDRNGGGFIRSAFCKLWC